MNKLLLKNIVLWCIFSLIVTTLALVPGRSKVPYTSESGETVNILFTHDIHDHYEEHAVTGSDLVLGGYTRLATAIKENKKSNSILVDGGDFSMGSAFQTVFEQSAPSLRVLGALGYDATTLGNHEFDYGSDSLATALSSVADMDCALPDLLVANMPDLSEDTGTKLSAALHSYGAKEYTIVERDGVKIGIFGIVGQSAMSSAYRSTTEFTKETTAAKEAVKALKAEGAELVVCISHSGTSSIALASADEKLANSVDGIDVIISGHSHSITEEPLYVNGTLIVSCGQYAEHLGSLTVVKSRGKWKVGDFHLIDIDDSFAEDADMQNMIDSVITDVNTYYMSYYGYSFDTVLAYSSFDFDTGLAYGNNHYNEPLGQFVCDAQKYAVQKAEGDKYETVDVAICTDASIRGSIDVGDVTAGEVYSVRGIGYGNDGYSGDPVVTFYLSGKELKILCEADASVTDFSAAIQIYMSGITYTYSPKSLFLSRVKDVYIVRDGQQIEVEDKQLYRVSTCLYNLSTFEMVTSVSGGIIKIIPKDKNGNAVSDYDTLVAHTDIDGKTVELKEWLAVAEYASSFPETDGVPQISNYYNRLFSERTELEHGDWVGYFVLIIVLAAVATAIALIVVAAEKRKKKNPNYEMKKARKRFLPLI